MLKAVKISVSYLLTRLSFDICHRIGSMMTYVFHRIVLHHDDSLFFHASQSIIIPTIT